MKKVGIKARWSVLANRRGAAAMEFALVAPLLFSMMLGTIEYGFVFYGFSTMQYSANNVARSIAVNKMDINIAQAEVNSGMPAWVGPATVTAIRTNAADPTKSEIKLEATTPAKDATPITIFTTAFPVDLKSTVTVKTELPFDN